VDLWALWETGRPYGGFSKRLVGAGSRWPASKRVWAGFAHARVSRAGVHGSLRGCSPRGRSFRGSHRVASVLSASEWTLVRQLRGPHLMTWA
jgi:hypothetical protein